MLSRNYRNAEAVFSQEKTVLVNIRNMRSDKTSRVLTGVRNPIFDGSTQSIPGPGFTGSISDNNGYDMVGKKPTERVQCVTKEPTIVIPLNEAPRSKLSTPLSPTNKDQNFKKSWDHLDSYVEHRKSMSGSVLNAKSSVEMGRSSSSMDKGRKWKLGKTCTLFLFTIAALSMIAAIFGIVTAEIFVKRGYFTRHLRVRLDPVPEEVTTSEPAFTWAPFNESDYAWLDDEFLTTEGPSQVIPTSKLNETNKVPIISNVPVSTVPSQPTSTSVPEPKLDLTVSTTRNPIPSTTLMDNPTTTTTIDDDNAIPDMVKLLSLPGPLQRFPLA